MRFEKWQALGNDYLIFERDELEGRARLSAGGGSAGSAGGGSAGGGSAGGSQQAAAPRRPLELTPARIRRICDPHFGVGGDGVLLLQRSERAGSVARLAIFNPDGSRAELSGNGSREAILYLRRRGWTERDRFTIDTDDGGGAAGAGAGRGIVVNATITGASTCTVDIGRARLISRDFPGGGADGLGELDAGGRQWRFRHVNVGNPQCAIAVRDLRELEALDLPAIGPSIESHQLFPNRTNVSWYVPLDGTSAGGGDRTGGDASAGDRTGGDASAGDRTGGDASAGGDGEPSRIRARIFERGVGETLSSGTGASGAAIAHVLAGGSSPVTVVLDGGQLTVDVEHDLKVNLTGWARAVFAGSLSHELIEELHETE
ncbi:MAG: diaminopimelate epimerase [Solirubrobacteraceae bacterium]